VHPLHVQNGDVRHQVDGESGDIIRAIVPSRCRTAVGQMNAYLTSQSGRQLRHRLNRQIGVGAQHLGDELRRNADSLGELRLIDLTALHPQEQVIGKIPLRNLSPVGDALTSLGEQSTVFVSEAHSLSPSWSSMTSVEALASPPSAKYL